MRRFARSGFGLLAIVGLGAVLGGAFVFVQGISARGAPPRAEYRLARAARHVLIPGHARALRNPLPEGPQVLASGRAHFADHCAACHGNDGRGRTDYGRRMSPRAPDMTAPATQTLSDGELFWIIENGVRLTGMPGFGDDDATNESESWELVRFIRSLPRITPEELAEMARLNPTLSRAAIEREKENDAFLAGEEPAKVEHPH